MGRLAAHNSITSGFDSRHGDHREEILRTIVEYVERENDLPLLRFYIHNAPHRRQHHRSIAVYRDELVAAAKASNIAIPITVPIAVSALFINPLSPDVDNLVCALWRALDGTSHSKPTVLKDDGLIHAIERTAKFYPETKK